jgi:ABC-type nitrate/sulfonate/bicarbonate transport system permease component
MNEMAPRGFAAAPQVVTRPPAGIGGRPWYASRSMEHVVAVLAPIALLLIWEATVRIGLLDARFFPAPSFIVSTFYYLTFEVPWARSLPYHVVISLSRVTIGFIIGAIPAIILGTVMGLVPLVRAAVQPIVGALFPIPKVAIMPLIMLIVGLGEESKWTIIAIGVFFQVLIATATGVANIDKIYFDVGRNFLAGRTDTFRRIALPGAMPTIFAGLRLGWGMALLLLVTAEMISADNGIGNLIWRAWMTLAVEDMYVGLVTIAFIGIVSFWLFDLFESLLLPWKSRR